MRGRRPSAFFLGPSRLPGIGASIGPAALLFRAPPLYPSLTTRVSGRPFSVSASLAGRDHDLHELAEGTHELLFWVLAVLVVAHAGAAFYHHLFRRDATLARMLPRGWLKVDGDA